MKWFFKFILSVLYPRKCKVCSRTDNITTYNICESCLKNIKEVPYQYNRCDVDNIIFYDDLFAAYYYESAIRELILMLKYRGRKDVALFFASQIRTHKMSQEFLLSNKWDYIIPVPLHKKRERRRGYNQSVILSEIIANIINTPIISPIKRSKFTRPLHNLTKEQRKKELEGAFSIKDEDTIYNKRILRIDDIITTRCTVNECARMLKMNGAQCVDVFILAQ